MAGFIERSNLRLIVRNTSSPVIDSLCDQVMKEDIAVACLCCGFLVQQELIITSMMGAILKRLVFRRDAPIYIIYAKPFERSKLERDLWRGLLLGDLTRMLRIVISPLPHVFIRIDALNECLSKHLLELLK